MATCNPSSLLEQAKCFSCLSKKELQAITAQLLCNIAEGGGSAARSVYTDVYADPNVAGLTPADPTQGAVFYQDPSVTLYNEWKWSVSQQQWYQFSAP